MTAAAAAVACQHAGTFCGTLSQGLAVQAGAAQAAETQMSGHCLPAAAAHPAHGQRHKIILEDICFWRMALCGFRV